MLNQVSLAGAQQGATKTETLPAEPRELAPQLARGVTRLLAEHGYGTLVEFRLPAARRVDVIGLDRDSRFVIVEIKTSVADFRADQKWREYLPYCDAFYFAVPEEFPRVLLPASCGLLVADAYGAAMLRPAVEMAMNKARRRHQLVRFALAAAVRLNRVYDPNGG
ncbi:MAG TPA: MmcB family DNA repair protein [Alphaproteobacteria bacterium]